MRYEITLGPNTNQWWVYDNEEDVYIDIPSFYLSEAKRFHTMDHQRMYLQDIIKESPKWLFEKSHWYKEVEI